MPVELDHHDGLLVRQMLGHVEHGFSLIDRDGQRPRFRDGTVVMGGGKDDAIDSCWKRVEIEPSAAEMAGVEPELSRGDLVSQRHDRGLGHA